MTEPPNKRSKTEGEKSKGYQYKSSKRHFLEVGQRGFLATCNFREKDCVRECYNILSQYADELYGPEPPKNESRAEQKSKNKEAAEADISDDLQSEIDATKAAAEPGRSRRFQAVDTGTKNCVFIKTTLHNPVELGTKIIKDIAEKRIQKTRYLLRLTPIYMVCKANVDEITKAAEVMFEKYFLEEGTTFAIVLNKRYNNDIKRDDIIKILADMVLERNGKNKVDLKNPELSVIVEIIKGKCCLSVVEGYFKYRKYNLVELGSNKSDTADKTEEAATDSKTEMKRKSNAEELRNKIIDVPIGSKLKELLEAKRINEGEPNPKKFKEEPEKQQPDEVDKQIDDKE